MTPEERFERIERQLEFLASNQAHHDAQIAENAKQIAENTKQIGQHAEQIGQLTSLTLRIVHVVEEQGRRMDEGFARLTESQRRTDERMSDLTQRLNTLINVVERYFSNGHH